MKKTSLHLFFFIAPIIFSEIIHAASHGTDMQYTDRIMVEFSETVEKDFSHSKILSLLNRIAAKTNLKLHYKHRISYGHVLQLSKTEPLNKALAISSTLMKLDDITYAEPDRKKFPALTPNDPFYPLQWNLHNGSGGINIESAWSQMSSHLPIIIAVIDTGITSHSDFNNRIVGGYDFITDPRTANDGDSRDNDPSDPGDATKIGECGDDKPNENLDSSWHGTIVTGLLVAETNNHLGISGIIGLNPQAAVLPIRVLGKCGGYTSDIIDGARWASGLHVLGVPDNPHPARILNLSLGGPGRCSQFEQQAYNEIIANQSIIVASSGNESADAFEYSPSGCQGVITVAASNRQDGRADYSNYGYSIDLSSPGGTFVKENLNDHLFSTYNMGKTTPEAEEAYAYVSGSSFAAPTVSGTIALLLDANPNLSLRQIYGTLRENSRAFSAANDSCSNGLCGKGILDIGKAISATLQNRIGDETMPNKRPYDQTVKPANNTSEPNNSADQNEHAGGGSLLFLNILLTMLLRLRLRTLNIPQH